MSARPGEFTRMESIVPCGRMTALSRLPIFLTLDGKRVLVAGGTPAAAWKAELLSAAGASVDVYSLRMCDELLALATDPPRGVITVHRREWTAGDLGGCTLAIGACDNVDEPEAFAAAARASGVLVNVIDRPSFCDFSFGSIVNRSPLVIGISTDGAAPVFAQVIRAKIETLLPRGFGQWAAAAARWRIALKNAGLTFASRRKFWQLFSAHAVDHSGREPDEIDFEDFLAEVRSLGSAVDQGSLTLVGTGPGDPELLTLRAVRALQSADLILFDDQVSSHVLDFARREAKKMPINVSTFPHHPDEIKGFMIGWAKSGKRVVRLSSGDPRCCGQSDEEIALCNAAGIAVEVVPGITDACPAASHNWDIAYRNVGRRIECEMNPTFISAHSS
jgi:uroporphyrin-III C-methyltransferase/precorrin-2 dehydrogenase/sirohydrochlorin ferrochelatase